MSCLTSISLSSNHQQAVAAIESKQRQLLNDASKIEPALPTKLQYDLDACAGAPIHTSSPDLSKGYACAVCAAKGHIWVCLTCDHQLCGHYMRGHAVDHHTVTGHPFVREPTTRLIWSYATDEFQPSPTDPLETLKHRLWMIPMSERQTVVG